METIIFTFLSQIICSNDLLAQVKYIKTFELENGTILFCTEKGIWLSDENLNQIFITNETEFENDVSNTDFDFVTISQFEEGEKYIIVAYKNIIFIFTSEGEYLTKGNIDFVPDGKYYTLVPYKIFRNNSMNEYNFIIGYLGKWGESTFFLSDFSFNESSNSLHLKHQIPINFSSSYNSNNGFSCNKLKSDVYDEVLTCFFQVDNNLTVSSFHLDNFTLVDNLYLVADIKDIRISFKSVIDIKKSKALICYLKSWHICTCEIYDINENKLTSIDINTENYKKQCKNIYSSTTIIYTPKKVNEYIFGCLGFQNDLFFIKFNSNFEIVSLISNMKFSINYTDDSYFILSIVKIPNHDTYSLFISYERQSFVFKNDLPEELNSGINVNESDPAGKLMSYLIMNHNNYSTHLINNYIIKSFVIEESSNILEQFTQNFFTENLYHSETENLTKENFNTYNNIENFTIINYNQKSSFAANTNELQVNNKYK